MTGRKATATVTYVGRPLRYNNSSNNNSNNSNSNNSNNSNSNSNSNSNNSNSNNNINADTPNGCLFNGFQSGLYQC